jgi:type IV pilus assembly protein PilC
MKNHSKSFSTRITAFDILDFFRRLSTLYTAGLSLMKCLTLLRQTTDKPCFRSLIHKLEIDLESGMEFNHCLRRYPGFFDSFCCQLIFIGEKTGTLDQSFKRITLYKEKNQTLHKQIKQALIYPGLVLLAALLTTFVLFFFVIPQFAVLFEHFPTKLPSSTRILIHLAQGIQQLTPSLGLVIFLGGLVSFHFKKSLQLQHAVPRLLLKLPLIKNLMIKIYLSQFSRNLALTLKAGLPLTEGLLLVAKLFSFKELKSSIQKIHEGVNSGKRLSACLERNPLFPTLLNQMIKIGEDSGTLDLMFEKIAEIYETELEQAIIFFKLLLEPLIIAILGVLIGGVVIIMYLPIFRLGMAI